MGRAIFFCRRAHPFPRSAQFCMVSSAAPPALSLVPSVPKLLAVDCGLRTGLALYELSGRLIWYRSHNFGSRARLKKAVWQILKGIDVLTHLVVEGGGPFTEIWIKEAKKRGLTVTQVQAQQWRELMLLPRQQRSGKQAKQVADALAREIIERTGADKQTSLRHDAAEAILVGWWHIQGSTGALPPDNSTARPVERCASGNNGPTD